MALKSLIFLMACVGSSDDAPETAIRFETSDHTLKELFDQEMADDFVEYHLLNPDEFWTPMPLPSIAVNDPAFRNIPGNNWSGQPQGLTYQRSIRALENYGHYAELTMLGKTFLEVLSDSMKFTQQFDPFTKTINNSRDGYGPSILTALEFVNRLHGIHIFKERIFWSSIDNLNDYEYRQTWNGTEFRIQTNKNSLVFCYIDGNEIARFSPGMRLVTDLSGKLIEMVGICEQDRDIDIENGGKKYFLTVKPNCVYRENPDGEIVQYSSVPFKAI